jgi:hypothetical protein
VQVYVFAQVAAPLFVAIFARLSAVDKRLISRGEVHLHSFDDLGDGFVALGFLLQLPLLSLETS